MAEMKNNKTLYVSDLDGTLLDNDSQLSQGTIDTLNHIIVEQGGLFTVATARTPATVVPLLQQVSVPPWYFVTPVAGSER